MKTKSLFLTLLALVVATGLTAKVKKIGMIGLDTSHSIAFVKSFNDKSGPHAGLGEYRVVAAYPHGSYTIPSSYERIPAYTDSVKKYGVEIVGSIDDLLKQVDYVLLETNDGNMHLEQAAQVMKAGKPMFIDKPIAGHLNEAIAIFELSKKYNVPLFSSSSLRYTAATQEIHNGKYGEVIGADSYGPDNSEPSHGDFTWYGIHAVEALYAVMGAGCKEVSCASVPGTEVATGIWEGDRSGTFRANVKAKYVFGGTVFTKEGAFQMGSEIPYEALLQRIIGFFDTGVVPVTPQETIEIFTFMEAASVSKARGGVPVMMSEVYEKASREAQEILKKY